MCSLISVLIHLLCEVLRDLLENCIMKTTVGRALVQFQAGAGSSQCLARFPPEVNLTILATG